MTIYVSVPIETDPDALAQDAFDYLQAKMPGWSPSDGQLDTWQIEANARMAATLRDIAAEVPASIFRYFGKLVNILPIDAQQATALTNWTLRDSLGHTIPAGTNVAVADTAGNQFAFELAADVVVQAGVTTANNVLIVAQEAGADSSGLGSPGASVSLLDQLAYVNTITLVDVTANGIDAEEDEVYLDRLSRMLRLLAPRPIIPADFADMSRSIAGVTRAVAIDGWDNVALTGGNARTLTVALADALGQTVSSTVKTNVQNLLVASRETTFVIYVTDPTYNTIDVQWDVNKWPDFASTDVTANINAAVASFFNPATWGAPPYGDTNLWYNTTTAKINDLITAIGRADGVKDVNTVTQRKSPAAFAASDVALTGVAPLTLPGTSSGTVH